MTEKRERNIYNHVCFAYLMSGISFILSIVVMLRYNYRTNLGIDYLGAIVAVLSLAVAVFVGVQVYQSFNLKRDIDEQNKKLLISLNQSNKELADKLQEEYKQLSDVYKEIENNAVNKPLCITLSQTGYSFYLLAQNTTNMSEKQIYISNAIPLLMNSIKAYGKGLRGEEVNNFNSLSIETLMDIKSMVDKGFFQFIKVGKDEYARYKAIAEYSNNERVKKFVDFLNIK